MGRRLSRAVVTLCMCATCAATAGAFVACNAILDNEARTLRPPAGDGDAPPGDDVVAPVDGACDPAKTSSDPRNCGSCGHDCEKGGCQAGVCQPYVFASAAGVDRVVVSGGLVFFVPTTGAPPRWCDVRGCDVAGGDIGTVGANDLAVEGNKVFVATGGDVSAYDVRASSGEVWAAVQKIKTITADAANVYFATSFGDVFTCARADKCAGGAARVAFFDGAATSIAVDDARLYWTTSDAGGVHEVAKSARDAGPSTSGLDGVARSVVVSGGVLYYAIGGGFYNGRITRAPGGLAGNLDTPIRDAIEPQGIAVEDDGGVIYYAEQKSAGSIRRCAGRCSAEGGAPTRIAEAQQARTVATTPSAIFWGNASLGVMKLVK
ncbi:MAG: hypothetical protein KF819_29045 [Labilithrix sp.]|nr:hypothetical protein [Labilithrix sp.]